MSKKTVEYKLSKVKSNIKQEKITSSKVSNEFARKFYHGDEAIYESMFVIFLNQGNKTIGWCKLSQGGISGTTIDIKLIAKYALDSLCSSVILVHNHPSGNTEPSSADIQVTDKVKDALELFGIILMDHIIISGDDDTYTSFADEGLI